MRRAIELPFEADVRPHARARSLRIRVHPGGRVSVTVPRRCSYALVASFLEQNRGWIERTRETLLRVPAPKTKSDAHAEYLLHKEAARRRAYVLIARLAPVYDLTVRAVSIRDQKSRWGSCSRSGTLSFNYRIALMPESLAEYIVAHELSHLIEFNHSSRFWAQVARTVPNHRILRKTLHAMYPTCR
jgi:predicted metal-dependent hydrolase